MFLVNVGRCALNTVAVTYKFPLIVEVLAPFGGRGALWGHFGRLYCS